MNSVAIGTNSIAIGRGGKDSGGDIVGSTAKAADSLAVLGGTTESAAVYSLALGGATYGTDGIFVNSVAAGKSSLAVLGGTTKEPAVNSLALGSAQEEDGSKRSDEFNRVGRRSQC